MIQWVNDNRSVVYSWAILIGVAVIFLAVSAGTQFHQLAIGLLASSVTLFVALAVFECAWQAGAFILGLFGGAGRT
ncbi:MAG: hypothetical protein HY056_17810 [Proteobacteria bacterium]|nr:hypothetical protein [Pseudomonadota bacterium]